LKNFVSLKVGSQEVLIETDEFKSERTGNSACLT